ncbi:MAG: ABC transporter ATP-binding protein [Candidatus Solibacter sp.]
MNPPSHAALVAVTDLSKRYGSTEAVCGVSFEIGAGQIFGLLGPNGAGKSTTLECVLGLRQPDRGSIRIAGLDVQRHALQVKLLVGAQLQAATLQDKITPRQALDLFGAFYDDPVATDDLLARFQLDGKADAPFSELSGGQRQRLLLAIAVIHRPQLLVLDEPSAGLDPQARRELRAAIREMRGEGRAVLLSTHDMEEAEQLCDRLAIMDRGRIVALATPAELIARAQTPARVTVRTAPPLQAAQVDHLPGIMGATCNAGIWTLETSAPNLLLAEVVRRADEASAELLDVALRRPSLEDVFIELTGRPWPGGVG